MLKSVTPAYRRLRSPTYAQGRDDKDAPTTLCPRIIVPFLSFRQFDAFIFRVDFLSTKIPKSLMLEMKS